VARDWAVFTGDIVKSTELGSARLEQVFRALGRAAEVIADWQDTPARLTRFRGDGWQMAVHPEWTFRALLAVRAAVRGTGKDADTRLGIGIGGGRIAGSDLAGAEGPAFVRSGHALDSMARGARMAAPEAALPLRVALPLADHLITGWTARQAEVALAWLSDLDATQDSVAQALKLTRQTVQGHLRGAGLGELLEVCDLLGEEKQIDLHS
jgi:DNA-binding CsgD family transcriptional regulator